MKASSTRIALVNAPIDLKYQDSTSLFCPPLGLMSIKAYLEQHDDSFDVLLLDGMILSLSEITHKLHNFKPQYLGISVQLLSYKNALHICKECDSAFTFLGGHHATQMAEKIIHNKHKLINCIVCSDGEEAILRICRGESPSDIPGVVCWDPHANKVHSSAPVLCKLDNLPNPYSAKGIDFAPYIKNLRDSSFSLNTGRYYRIYSHKGCRFRASGKKCVFCGRADEGYRFFSVDRFFMCLSDLHVGENDFVFDVGDDLSGNIPWLTRAVTYMRDKNIAMPKLGIFGRGDEITPTSARLLRELSVVDVTMGVETGDNDVLHQSGKNIAGANIYYKSARTLFENGIGLTPSYVLGLPGENPHSLRNTIKHAQVIKELSKEILGAPPGEIVANLLEPLPGSNAFTVLENAFPYKYLLEDELDLEIMQRDYFCTIFSLDGISYVQFRDRLRETGRIINGLADFADPQGWMRNEL